mgnify:CR=1 FL=1
MSETTSNDAATQARLLAEALPFMQRYENKTVVVKYGGHAMGDTALGKAFAQDIALLKQSGVNPIVVHGGGPMINDLLKKLGIQSEFVRGKRVTDQATVEVVEMVLTGLVNKRIVQAIMDEGGRAVGLSGKDDDLMVCEMEDPELGWVGRPVEMNVQVLRDLMSAGIIPVVAPVATGMDPVETFNVNGDTAAGAIAIAAAKCTPRDARIATEMRRFCRDAIIQVFARSRRKCVSHRCGGGRRRFPAALSRADPGRGRGAWRFRQRPR